MIWLLGCAAAVDTAPTDTGAPTDADTDADTDTDTDADTDTDTLTGELPVIRSVDLVDCSVNAGGEIWRLSLTADDPQGAETVGGGTVEASVGGAAVDQNVVSCNVGRCTGTFSLADDAVGCVLDGTVVFRFVVQDEDGNLSAAETYDTAADGE